MKTECRNVAIELFENTQQVNISVDENKNYSFPIGTAENLCTAITELLRLRTRKIAFEGKLDDISRCKFIVSEMQEGWMEEHETVKLINPDTYDVITYGKLMWNTDKLAWFIRNSEGDYYFTIDEMDYISND